MAEAEKMTVEELNKWIRRIGMSVADMGVARAEEGVNPLIPRQLYELAAGIQCLLKFPEFQGLMLERLGGDGVRELGRSLRREFGNKAATTIYFMPLEGMPGAVGRGILLNSGVITRDDYREELSTVFTFCKELLSEGLWQGRGAFTGWDMGYVQPILDGDIVQRLSRDLEPLRGEEGSIFSRFNAAAQLQGFMMHFDCRLGLSDSGPYEVGDKLILTRDVFVNEEAFHWSNTAEGLPHAYTLVMGLEKARMMEDRKSGRLKYFAIYDTGTTLAVPLDAVFEYVVEGAAYMREKWNTPMDKVQRLNFGDLPEHTRMCSEATARLFQALAKMPEFEKILCGMFVYQNTMLPFLRMANLYEEACSEYDFWGIHPKFFEYYTRAMEKAFEAGAMMVSGMGFGPFPVPGY